MLHMIIVLLTRPARSAFLTGMAGEPVQPLESVQEEPLFVENPPPSKADIYRKLLECRGNITKVAREFGVRRSTVKKAIDTTPELVSLLEEMREGSLDHAEDNMFSEVEKGSESASRFVLGTLGKKRGWAQGVEGTGDKGQILVEITRFSEDPPNG